MSMDFSYLELYDARLAEYGSRALQYVEEDPSAALAKVRNFIERATRKYAAEKGIPDDAGNLYELICLLEKGGHLNGRVAGDFHTARKLSNCAVHDEPVSIDQAKNGVEAAYRVARHLYSEPSNLPSVRRTARAPVKVALADKGSAAFDGYRGVLRTVSAALRSLKDCATEAGESDIASQAAAQSTRLEGRKFHVAFVGEFKAGKSTLVNTLLGEELLATATRECTTVVTTVRSDPAALEGSAVGTTMDGRSLPLRFSNMEAELTSRRDSADALAEVALTLPGSRWFGQDVLLVDTPGTAAAGLVREQATLRWLPQSDAVVFLTRADQLLSASEEAFLRNHILPLEPAGLFVLVNHADKIRTASDRRILQDRLHTRLEPMLGSATRTHWISAADAMDALAAIAETGADGVVDPDDEELLQQSGVPHFQDALIRYLAADRAAAEAERHRGHGLRLAVSFRQRLEARLSDTELDSEALSRRIARTNELLEVLQGCREDLVSEVNMGFERLNASLQEDARRVAASVRSSLSEDSSKSEAKQTMVEQTNLAAARVQRALQGESDRLRALIAARLAGLHDASSQMDPIVVANQFDMAVGALVQQKTHQRTVREAVGTARSVELTDDMMFGAAMGAFIGGALFGGVGAVLGGYLLGGLAGSDQRQQWTTRKESSTVLNVTATVSGLEEQLRTEVRRACSVAESAVQGALTQVITSACDQARRRLSSLQDERRNDHAPAQQAALKRLLERATALEHELL